MPELGCSEGNAAGRKVTLPMVGSKIPISGSEVERGSLFSRKIRGA